MHRPMIVTTGLNPASYRLSGSIDRHHLVRWIHDGPGDLPNLAPLCYRHHWMVHEGGCQLVRTDDGRFPTVPPSTGFERLPHGPD